jgi:hypothetical protein
MAISLGTMHIKYFNSNPQFASWDPSALEAFLASALYIDPSTGQTRLKCTPVQEACCYEMRTQGEMWELLPTLSERIELFWIVAAVNDFFVPAPDVRKDAVWRRPVNASNVIIDCGHFVSGELASVVKHESFVSSDPYAKAQGAW